MESFTGHMAPINPRINGFDTYVGKQLYRAHCLHKILCPWAANNLPEAKIAENNVTMRTLKGAEKFVKKSMVNVLAKYVFKVNELSLFEKIKIMYKIKKMVNFMADFKNHLLHTYPLMPKDLKAVGIPARDADSVLDAKLRKMRNICEEITLSSWSNGDGEFYIRKIFFSGKNCYTLYYVPVAVE